MIREITLGGKKLRYKLIYKSVKNLNVRINAEKEICVSANRLMSFEYIESFLEQNAVYILKAVERNESIIARNEKERMYSDGDAVYLLGEKLTLRVIDSYGNKTEKRDSELLIYTESENRQRIKALVERWYDEQCRYIFGIIGNRVYQAFTKYVPEPPEYSYKYMTSRWGSCNPVRRKISINKNLIKYDAEIIELVFCHEFTHFIYPDHSKRFYDFMAHVLPDHAERRKRLNLLLH